jgi:hypothetical protein
MEVITFFLRCLQPKHPCLDFVCDLLDLTFEAGLGVLFALRDGDSWIVDILLTLLKR